MYDIIVIGGGIIGTSIVRELTKYQVKVLLLEKELDVSMGATKANSAIVHGGYDPESGTLMAKYNVRGSQMYETMCKELNVPYIQNGSLVVAKNQEEMKTIEKMLENGKRNGVKELEIIDGKELEELEPNLNKGFLGALKVPTGAIVGPFELAIALAENAIKNGGEILLDSEVVGIVKEEARFVITTKTGTQYQTKYVINASGINADDIHNLICKERFSITARKGEYHVMDKVEGKLVKHTIFPCPTKYGKGILITPTVHGNLLVGPNAIDTEDKVSVATTAQELNLIKEKSMDSIGKLNFRNVIRSFSGLRALPSTEDFIIGEDPEVKGFIDVAGIKSPGLTSAPAIAEDMISILRNAGLTLVSKNDFDSTRTQIDFMKLSIEEKNELIQKHPKYGRIICRCENITEGEICDAIQRSFGPATVEGIKRRCRPGMGRCQGSFCGPRILELIAEYENREIETVVLDQRNSKIIVGKTK